MLLNDSYEDKQSSWPMVPMVPIHSLDISSPLSLVVVLAWPESSRTRSAKFLPDQTCGNHEGCDTKQKCGRGTVGQNDTYADVNWMYEAQDHPVKVKHVPDIERTTNWCRDPSPVMHKVLCLGSYYSNATPASKSKSRGRGHLVCTCHDRYIYHSSAL